MSVTIQGTGIVSHMAATIGSGAFASFDDVVTQIVLQAVMAALSDGRDDDADLDGVNDVPWATRSGSVYTCIRIGLPRDLWVRAGVELRTAQFAGPWCTGDVLLDGTVVANGNNAVTTTPGAATAAGTFPATQAGAAGGAAGANNNGVQAGAVTIEWPQAGRFHGTAGGNGAASSGGTASTVSALSATRGTTHGMVTALGIANLLTNLGLAVESCGPGGSGGGGNAGGAGGAGGAGAGMVHMSGRTLTISPTGGIFANGGKGGNGTGTGSGGGGGGSGGRVRLLFGTVTLADPVTSVQIRGGEGGAPGDATGFYGPCGAPGEIMYLAGKPAPFGARTVRRTMSATEIAAAFAGGRYDVSFKFTVGSSSGQSTGVVNTGTGGGGLEVVGFDTPDGFAGLRFNAANFRLDQYARGVVVQSTADLNSTVAAGPTFQPFIAGDVIEGRVWYDPTGTPDGRSMGIRWAVNRCSGLDTVGTASGARLNVPTAGRMLGTGETPSSFIAQPRSADIVGTIVLLGDSIIAGRKNSVGWDGVTAGSRMRLVTQWCVSLAVQGATIANMSTAWNASPMRGNQTLVAVIFQTGHNDLNVGRTAVQVTADTQTIRDDVATQNPGAKFILAKLSPSYNGWASAALRTAWDTVQANFDGTGTTPVSAHARATAHVASMGDANKSLRERSEAGDYTHPNYWGRNQNGASFRTAYDSIGLAA